MKLLDFQALVNDAVAKAESTGIHPNNFTVKMIVGSGLPVPTTPQEAILSQSELMVLLLDGPTSDAYAAFQILQRHESTKSDAASGAHVS